MKKQSTLHCDCLQKEKNVEIKTPETHIKKETTCYCTPKECDCTVTREEIETPKKKRKRR